MAVVRGGGYIKPPLTPPSRPDLFSQPRLSHIPTNHVFSSKSKENNPFIYHSSWVTTDAAAVLLASALPVAASALNKPEYAAMMSHLLLKRIRLAVRKTWNDRHLKAGG
ncbi:hypothetical protein AWENTII_008411 [Aspergillus wentii]